MAKKIITHKKCDVIGCDGEFHSSGGGYSNTNGIYYAHKCNVCGKEVSFLNKTFPNIDTEYDVIEHVFED